MKIKKLEQELKKELAPRDDAYVVIEHIELEVEDKPYFIEIRGRYGYEKSEIGNVHCFDLVYTSDRSLEYIKGKFALVVEQNENANI